MNENGGPEDTDNGAAGGAINRRRVLKGAVAAGVGAAVWTAPNIRTLGSTPAYATHTDTTQIPTSIEQSDSFNATCSDGGLCPGGASWGPTGGTAGSVRINPTKDEQKKFNLDPNDYWLVDVTGCVLEQGTAIASQVTAEGVDFTALGYCIQVAQIYTSNSGNPVNNFVIRNAKGDCDPKTFDATPTKTNESCSYFLRATILITDLEGSCCSP